MSAKQRSLQQIVDDGLWPHTTMGDVAEDEFPDFRTQALAEVMQAIPDGDYQRLKARAPRIRWFMPHPSTRGKAEPVFVGGRDGGVAVDADAFLLYLSPLLESESESPDVRIAVVAHELAHVVLCHDFSPADDEVYEKQENEVFDCLCRWGFEREAQAHRALTERIRNGSTSSP